MTANYHPLGSNVLGTIESREQTSASGIVVPIDENSALGGKIITVTAVGPLVSEDIKPGMRVCIGNAGQEIDPQTIIVPEHEILLVIE